jgi:hypothetical protein
MKQKQSYRQIFYSDGFLQHVVAPTGLYEGYSEINLQQAGGGRPIKMTTWHWHSTDQ